MLRTKSAGLYRTEEANSNETRALRRNPRWHFSDSDASRPAADSRRRPAPTLTPTTRKPESCSSRSRLPRARTAARRTSPSPGAVNQGPFDPGNMEVRTAVQPAGQRQDLESGEAEVEAGRQGDRRHRLQLHRSGHLLRHGECRLRLHLDRNAARSARLGAGGPYVAHLPARQSRSGRARRLRRRTRDPARHRRRRSGDRRADRGHRRRGDRGAELDLLPAARPAQPGRRPGFRRRTCGAASRAAIARPPTTTSC